MIARNSSFSFRESTSTAAQIAAELGADYLVTGSIRKGGNKVRITANLISGADDEQVWSQKWDRPMDDIFEVQDEVSQAIVALLAPALTGQEQKRLATQRRPPTCQHGIYICRLSASSTETATSRPMTVTPLLSRNVWPPSSWTAISVTLMCFLQVTFRGCFSNEYAHQRAENEALFHKMAQRAYDLDPTIQRQLSH